jgi:GNAT superfamily N-acetyltransferase
MSEPASAAIHVRPAQPTDVSPMHTLLLELAAYERLSHAVQATADSLREALFGARPVAEAIVVEAGRQIVGYALYFTTYSTFVGRPGMYLEDLYVQPAWRGQGIGKRLLAEIARQAVERSCGRLEWAVLDWNQPSIDFYQRLGARPLDDWTTYRMTGEPLAALAKLTVATGRSASD